MALFYTKSMFILHFICSTLSAPQQPEINDQFTANTTADVGTADGEAIRKDDHSIKTATNTEVDKNENRYDVISDKRKYLIPQTEVIDGNPKPNLFDAIYIMLTRPINDLFSSPKVSFVLRNVGTCIVNGAMEIISHYLPPPFIPLIASAAGMVIPFEPVVMLKEKIPVTSYRRAFKKAMNSFLNTFDAYKLDNFDDDPYMTRRFNRRFMNDISGERNKKSNDID